MKKVGGLLAAILFCIALGNTQVLASDQGPSQVELKSGTVELTLSQTELTLSQAELKSTIEWAAPENLYISFEVKGQELLTVKEVKQLTAGREIKSTLWQKEFTNKGIRKGAFNVQFVNLYIFKHNRHEIQLYIPC